MWQERKMPPLKIASSNNKQHLLGGAEGLRVK